MLKRIKTLMLFPLAAAVMAGALAAGATAAETKKMSKEHLKELITSAKTPADHQKIATHYRQEAARLQTEKQEHEDMAAAYLSNPSSHPIPKYPTLGQHCKDLAQSLDQAAKQALEMAAIHEEMAKAAKQ